VSEQLAPAVRVNGKTTGPGTFTVRSATDPSQSWTVEWQSARTHWCGCPAFARSKENKCRHVEAVFAAIAREWQQRRAADVAARKEEIAS
jgi:hypothetical protein